MSKYKVEHREPDGCLDMIGALFGCDYDDRHTVIIRNSSGSFLGEGKGSSYAEACSEAYKDVARKGY